MCIKQYANIIVIYQAQTKTRAGVIYNVNKQFYTVLHKTKILFNESKDKHLYFIVL